MTTSTHDPIITQAFDELRGAAFRLVDTCDLELGTALLVMFEVTAEMFRSTAPLEFDSYLRTFAKEISRPQPNQEHLDLVRDELIDIFSLVCS